MARSLYQGELKSLKKHPIDADLYLSVKEPWKDELVTNETKLT